MKVVETDKCEHGLPLKGRCMKCSENIEKNKIKILEFVKKMNEAHERTSSSTLKF